MTAVRSELRCGPHWQGSGAAREAPAAERQPGSRAAAWSKLEPPAWRWRLPSLPLKLPVAHSRVGPLAARPCGIASASLLGAAPARPASRFEHPQLRLPAPARHGDDASRCSAGLPRSAACWRDRAAPPPQTMPRLPCLCGGDHRATRLPFHAMGHAAGHARDQVRARDAPDQARPYAHQAMPRGRASFRLHP
jgi:hypothetical protein